MLKTFHFEDSIPVNEPKEIPIDQTKIHSLSVTAIPLKNPCRCFITISMISWNMVEFLKIIYKAIGLCYMIRDTSRTYL